jgi:hypothetical protein
MKLLSTNSKLNKGLKVGIKTFGIHLAPEKLSGYQVCNNASEGCKIACLNTAGRGIQTNVQKARIEKTRFFFLKRGQFFAQLIKEVDAAIRHCDKHDLIPAFRPNLTSDLPFHKIKHLGKSIIDMFPSVQFYDYTPNLDRMVEYLEGKLPSNYHLTFSRKEDNELACDAVMASGGNLAIVFRGKLPETYKGKKVVDGDKNDARFLDPKGVIIGLVEKGLAKKDKSGFVVEPI